jgi:predicted hydrocarbon binding protein
VKLANIILRYYTRSRNFPSTISLMSEKTPLLDFERSWQNKLAVGLDQLVEPTERDWILSGGETLTMESPSMDKIIWTCEMLERLGDRIDPETAKQVFVDCHCSYPVEDLLEAKMTYRLFEDVDQVLSLLQTKFEVFLRDVLELDEDLVSEIISRDWGLAGVRDGESIIATKIPKSSYLVDYFEAEDPLEKRKLYCHCPRVRDGVGEDPQLMEEYCYCGAGFYQGIWETILGEPVQVEVLESVMHGGDVCKIAIHLPESININYNA